ncbi:Uncharacterised protein [Mycobacteroides abscessus subsp. abscessus]|nr:Uncharacterised protein [Mycobacteroides abscessus subsp. abscessus]
MNTVLIGGTRGAEQIVTTGRGGPTASACAALLLTARRLTAGRTEGGVLLGRL